MISRLLSRLFARIEARTLAIMLLVAAALWGFAALASEVMESELQSFDSAILLAFRSPGDLSDPIGPKFLEVVMRDITALGGATWLFLLSFSVVLGLVIRGRRRLGLQLAVAVLGGQVLSHLAKGYFVRPRPDLVPHISEVTSSSFPSGHTMMATATYLTLAVMIAQIEPMRRMRVYYLVLAAFLSVIVGISRVYLGVHWPSDVLAGWMVGAAWALSCYLVAHWASDRRQVTSTTSGSPRDVLKVAVLGPALLLCLVGHAAPARAEGYPFAVILGGRTLGTIEYEDTDEKRPLALHARFDNTPLGVFDGTFEATSQQVRTEAGDVVLQYLGITQSTRKSRTVSVLHDGGRALATSVSPVEEETDLSSVGQVPVGIIDPVEAFGRLIETSGCPGAFGFYDGRRVIKVSIDASDQDGNLMTCHATYQVVAGPGHLSPLGITSFDMDLIYDLAGGERSALKEIDISTGIFEVRLVQ